MMNNTKLLYQTVGLTLVVLLLAGCGRVRTEPTATTAVVVEAQPTPTDTSTPTPTATHTPTPSPAQSVQVICLNVDRDLPQEPISTSIWRILTGLGLQVVDAEMACDATLDLALTINALGASYAHEGSSGSSYCYTGAEILGQMTLTTPGGEPWELPISAKRAPASGRIYGCPKSDEAPFHRVWPQPVLDGLALLWGPQVFVQALNVPWIEGVQTSAARSLEEIGAEEVEGAIPALLQVSLWKGDDEFYSYPAEMPGDVSSLIRILEEGEESWQMRVIAARRLADLFEETAIPALLHVLEDENLQVRIAAAWALGEIGGGEGVVPALIEALEDQEPWVRETAAWALGEIGQEEGVVPALTQAIGDPNLSVRETAIDAISPYWFSSVWEDDSARAALALALAQALEDEALAGFHWKVMLLLERMGPQAMEAVPDPTGWTTYTTEDGLAGNRVEAIAVGPEGDLWFGSDGGGVSRFDGESWTTYTTEDGLAGNAVMAIAVGPEGDLWFGTGGSVRGDVSRHTPPD
jgi:HEAT repeat protein